MKNCITALFLLFFPIILFAQDSLENKLKALLDNNQFDAIVEKYAAGSGKYSAKALYYIGFACFIKEDNDNCIRLMSLSIGKDPNYSRAYFIRAATYNYMQKYNEAIKDFQAAIGLNPENGEYYSGLGDSYYNLGKADLALAEYVKAAAQQDAPERALLMIPQIYAGQKEDGKALEAYYTARSKVPHESNSYADILYNIGLFEFLKGNYDKAETALLELVQLAPGDFHTYAKLVQVYYGRKEYEKAKPYKDKLYEAHKKGVLEDNLKDMFCFDQFKWKDKQIQAFERYEEGPSKSIYNKHLFYVVNQDGKIEFSIQTEYSPVSAELGGAKYLLCMSAGNTHSTFNIGFNDDLKYDELKSAVIAVLEGKVKPAASSRPGG
jgi:tetratricopeptide (TPR) repeat protein